MTMPVRREKDTLFHFGGFTLDLKRRALHREGERIHLTSKPLEVLIFLVHNRGRLIEKRELIDAVWNGVFVTDDNLVQAIIEIRRALRDNKNDPHFIETVPRRGYRFVAEVSQESSPLEFPTAATTPFGIHEIKKVPKHPLLSKAIANPKRSALIVSGLVILAVGVALVNMLFFQHRSGAGSVMPFETAKFTRITTSGKVAGATVSPDGRYVIYALRSEGKESLWLKQVATASDVQITEPTEALHQGLTFSPDGSSLCYVVRDKNQLGELYQMPLLGGVAKKLKADVDSAISFSPDGKRISFFRGYPEKNESVLVIANADGAQPQELAIRKTPDFFPTLLDGAPAWSPGTGGVIACPAGSSDATGRYMTVVEVQAERGAIAPLTSRRWWQVGQIAWLRDGSGLIVVAKERASDPSQIWLLPYPTGEARRITNDLNDYVGVSLTRESPSSLVTVQSDVLSSISTAPAEGDVTDISISSAGGLPGLSWTPDGRIVYAARLKGNLDIYVMQKDGSNQKQLTADAGDNNWPSVSPDGRYIVFTSSRTGRRQIWRMNLDGGDLKQLTSGGEGRWPRCAPDSQWVVYVSLYNPTGLFKVLIEGGDPVQLTDKTATCPAISPDGKLIATGYHEDPGADKTAIYSFDAGALLKVLDLSSPCICWKPDGDGLMYIDQHGRNIFSQPIEGGPPLQLTRFKDGSITAFDWSRDGGLTCSRKVVIADAVIISDVR